MTVYNFHIMQNEFRALAYHMADKKEVRYYLHGIHVDPASGAVTATDGHRLMSMVIDVPDVSKDCPVFIIPADLIKHAAKGSKNEVVPVAYDAETKTVSLSVGAGMFSDKAVDGRYPDWRRLIPDVAGLHPRYNIEADDKGRHFGINPRYYYEACVALSLANGRPVAKAKNEPMIPCVDSVGSSDIRVLTVAAGREDITCLVMPMRID